MSLDLVTNVVVAGVPTGLVYGLMALGLSVIFGVVRVGLVLLAVVMFLPHGIWPPIARALGLGKKT